MNEMINLHHSAAVHVPLALAFLFPLIHVLLLILIKTQLLPHRTWFLHIGVVVVQLVGAALAYLTGQRDMVLSSAPTELLVEHQELAFWFMLIWLAVLCLLVLAVTLRNLKWSIFFHGALLVLLASQFYIAVRVGQIGGKLVFGI
ncbi:MAG: hypothetical protein AB7N80_04920 [Bdellovibrionales bacterium]